MMKQINVLGKPCPIPVIETKKAIRELSHYGGEIEVLLDNEIPKQNLEKMAKGMGYAYSSETLPDGNISFKIQVSANKDNVFSTNNDNTATLVVFKNQCMGDGDETLGKILMKSFIYALSELDIPPQHLIFLNSAVFLTNKNSDSLEDLRQLSKKGSLISNCGTCLDFYGIKNDLAIGEITNMYGIVEMMVQAKKILTP